MLPSCTTVKRYKSIKNARLDTNNLVSIDLFGTKVDAAKEDNNSKSLWDLQAEGQAELIKALDKRNSDEEKFASALNAKYLKEKEKLVTDYTSKDVRLIFSISKKRDFMELAKCRPKFTLADRIEYVQFDITIPAKIELNFIRWNKFITEYATIDVADMSFNQSLEVSASTGISSGVGSEKTVGNEKATESSTFSPSLNAKGTISKTEAQKLRYRYVALNGTINDKKISIEQEGMREIDLNGNVIVDINLKFVEILEKLTTVEGCKTPEGVYNTPDKMKIVLFTAHVPYIIGLPDTIKAILHYQYVYRHVKKGAKTYYEWDDKIEYLKGDSVKTISLLKKKDYLPDFYNLAQIGQDSQSFDQRTRIILTDTISKDTLEMIFPSLSDAQEFWVWLNKYNLTPGDSNKPIVVGSYKLFFRNGSKNIDLTKQVFNSIKSNMAVLPYYRFVNEKKQKNEYHSNPR